MSNSYSVEQLNTTTCPWCGGFARWIGIHYPSTRPQVYLSCDSCGAYKPLICYEFSDEERVMMQDRMHALSPISCASE